MKPTRLLAIIAVGVGVASLASNASAALTYFDADVYGYTLDLGKAGTEAVPANTTLVDGSPVPVTLDGGSGGTGSDGLWRVRTSNGFGNRATGAVVVAGATDKPSADEGNGEQLIGDILEARGDFNTDNTENVPVLKTTVNVPPADIGQEKAVLVFFWTTTAGGQSWQIAASLTNTNNDFPATPANPLQPVFGGAGGGRLAYNGVLNVQNDGAYMREVYDASSEGTADVGANGATDVNPIFAVDDSLLTTTDGAATGGAAGDRQLWAAFIGNQVLGSELTAYINESIYHGFEFATFDNGRARVWYDGIGYTDPLPGVDPLPDVTIPEPTGLALLSLALACAARRRSN